MTDKISRRDFLKLASLGAATSAVLTGCGPASKLVTRQPYFAMPEYTYNGESTYYATTCRECAAACGLIVRTIQGRAIKIEGNANHPINLGKTCARGQTSLQGLYNPDRVTGPTLQKRAKELNARDKLTWEDAIQVVAETLKTTPPSGIAFLLGMAPDHLFDLVTELTTAIGAPAPLRFGALGMFESRGTLSRAVAELFGQAALPYFDLSNADIVLSFGANFLETWISPVSYTRGYSSMRKGKDGGRGYLVQFEARMSQTGAVADEWIPVRPGTEGLIALALGGLVARARGGALPAYLASIDPADAAGKAGIPLARLEALAQRLVNARAPLIIPGGAALAQSNGLQVAKAILALNTFLGNPANPTLLLSPLAPGQTAYQGPMSVQEMEEFVRKLESGAIKTLFIHGVNPVFELPKALGLAEALGKVEKIISFATFPDETALMADYILPDHHGLESFGYQRAATGAANPAGLPGESAATLSSLQPVVSPFHDTRATVDLLLAAAASIGGNLQAALNYPDEFAFIQAKLNQLLPVEGGSFAAPEINTFMANFQQHGGWWKPEQPVGANPTATASINPGEGAFEEGEFFLLPFVSPVLGEAGANKPWLQEVPDPTTTVVWNTWVEIHPAVAHELGLENDDVVKIISASGELEAPIYLYPAIRPDTIAIPYGQGHTAYGRFASGRGVNPADLFGVKYNEAGDLAFGAVKIRIEKTGRRQLLSRLESRMGVYGEGMGEEH